MNSLKFSFFKGFRVPVMVLNRKHFTRSLPALLIPGGTGHIGSHLAVEGLKRNWEVFPCSRRAPRDAEKTALVHPVMTPEDKLKDTGFWYEVIGKVGLNRPVFVFNCIGNPDAEDMEAVNVAPAEAIAAAVKKFQDEGFNVGMGQASSMAVVQLPEFPYGETKKMAEEAILSTGINSGMIMRIGYAVDGIPKGETFQLNLTHAYDAPHLVAGILPFLRGIVPVIGNGQQKFQPVVIKDIVDAALNFATRQLDQQDEGILQIDGVGRQVITQIEFYQAYAEILGVALRCIHLEPEKLMDFARRFPMGHFSEYAIEGLRKLTHEERLFSAEELEKLLGRETMTLKDLLADAIGKPVEYARPPVSKHMWQIAEKVMKCSESRRVFLKTLVKVAPDVAYQLLRKG